jgi:ASC-1-like (ASCH) protein
MKYSFDINNRAFKAIKNKTKRVEIRSTKLGENHFDYSILKNGDEIEFKSYDNEKINCLVGDVNHYDSIEELLTLEGTRYTLSSTNDFEAGIKSINSINGYEEAIKINGVYAIHITPIED